MSESLNLAGEIIERIAERYRKCVASSPELTVVEAVLRCAQEEGFRLVAGEAAPSERERRLQDAVKAFCMHVTENGDLRKSGPFAEQDGKDHLADWVGGCQPCIDLFNAMEKLALADSSLQPSGPRRNQNAAE